MTDNATSPLVSLIQLGRSARAAKDSAQLGFVMVNETLSLLNYRQASLWLTKGLGSVAAVSGVPQPDPNAPYVQWLGHVLRHWTRVSPTSPMAVSANDLPEALAAEWDSWLPNHGIWLPLTHQDSPLGGLFLARDYPWSEAELALSKELMDLYSHALASYNPLKTPSLWERLGRRKAWIAGGFLAVCVFPIPMSVLAPAKVVPKEPFLVRAPQNGVIDSVVVRPNQTVAAGELLLSLDPRVLKSQHELAQQAYSTAEEEYRQSAQLAVTEDKGKLEMTVRHGQLLEKSVELNYSQDQLERVQVKAERGGVVVFTDVNEWLGKAVILGEKILTLADPNHVELSIDLPANDIIPIAVGAKVKLYPNANPMSSYTAKVLTLSYEAVPVPSGVLAYRVSAELDADQPLPRIGLMGTAKISGNWVPLAYYLLRKPLTAVRQRSGW